MKNCEKYNLLPFNFYRVGNSELLINEIGDYIAAPIGTVQSLVNRQCIEENLYKSLVANYFIYEDILPTNIDIYASRMKTKKGFVNEGTSLHIFVLTLRCNQNCVYCQASSRASDSKHCSMTKETMENAVKLMFRSKSKFLTMELQGGEPTLEIQLVKYGIELAEKINEEQHRKISYVLCTNSINLTEEVLSVCKQYNMVISTSLDGPAYIHNYNRGHKDSYEKVVKGINKAREVLGHDKVSALMTTSMMGINYPIEIIDEYIKLGFPSVFLRALNPYGLASENENWEEYTERFIEFYKTAFEHILEVNKAGTFFIEEYASIILRKILTPFTTGFVDLQSPAGIINSVLVYNYDGYVYASDESRMLAEFNDHTFCLGKVSDRYEDLIYGDKSRKMASLWATEYIAGCSDCPISPYCGADPVRNYSTQGDMYGIRFSSTMCQKNKAIIEYILSLLIEREDEVLPIFKSWLA